jgi:hypothetical protein
LAGTYSVGGTTQCAACTIGKYSASNGAVGCTAASSCGSGTRIKTASTLTTDTICEACAVGKASAGGQSACDDCNGDGEYSDETGLSAFKTASAGMKPTSSRDNVEDCAAGTFSVGGTTQCTDCVSGKYSASTGAVGCTAASSCGSGTRIKTASTPTADTICEA